MAPVETIWQKYLAEGGESNATAFGVWLIKNNPQIAEDTLSVQNRLALKENGYPSGFDSMDSTTKSAILIGRLERFIHYLSKPVFKESGLSEDEFVVLVTLLYMPKAAKVQLLKQCLIEIPTGSELLKRMKKTGLILERKHPEDGRSTIISLSAKGRQVLFRSFQQVGKVEDALSALSAKEKDMLLGLLDRLDLHHSRRHEIKQVRELMEMQPS